MKFKIHNKILSLVVLLSLSFTSYAQQDTVWVSKNYLICGKQEAKYYRLTPKKIGSFFEVQQYYLNGKLFFKGKSAKANEQQCEGELVMYDTLGNKMKTIFYKKGIIIWEKSYDKNRVFELYYKNGLPYTGEIFQGKNKLYFCSYKNGEVQEEKRFYNKSKKLKELYTYENGGIKSRKYYNKSGKLLGELLYEKNQIKEGEFIFFHRDSPDLVSEIAHYKNFQRTHTDYFYKNGKPKSVFTVEKPITKTFYSTKGNVLGKLRYKGSLKNRVIDKGLRIYFVNSKREEGIVAKKELHEDGKIQWVKSFYEDGKLKSEMLYEKEGYKILHEVNFSRAGDTIAFVNYKDYKPWNGLKIGFNKKTWYTDGKITKEIEYYHKTDTIFSKRLANEITYFDKQNKILGKLTLQKDASYEIPLYGRKVTHSMGLYTFNDYENEKLKKTTYQVRNYSTKKVYKAEIYYRIGENNKREKEIHYYANGNKQSEIIYTGGYSKEKGLFYNDKGEQIGVYDYKAKEGDLYTFFSTSDQVERITKTKGGVSFYEKKYKRNNDIKEGQKGDFYVAYEVDTKTEGNFFNAYGEVLYHIRFKDGKPFEGKVLDPLRCTVTSYKNGKKEGVFFKAASYKFPEVIVESGNYVNDKKEGVFKYYKDRSLVKQLVYNNDKLNGKALFFNKYGEQIGSLIYKDDAPYEGESISKTQKKYYKKGKLIKKVSIYKNTGDIEEVFNEDKSVATLIYYSNSRLKKYEFTTLKSNYLNGEVIRYNEKGKKQHSAVFENGELLSGTIWLKDYYSYSRADNYYAVTKVDNTLSLKIYNSDDKVIFEAKEMDISETKFLTDKLYIRTKYITSEKLY